MSTFKIGSSIQAIDKECGIWLTGKIKKIDGRRILIQWAGYSNSSWVASDFVRSPLRRRIISAAHVTLRTLQRGDKFRKTIPSGGLSPPLVVENNDPFLCEINTSIGVTVKYESIAGELVQSDDDDDDDTDDAVVNDDRDDGKKQHDYGTKPKKRKTVNVEKPAACVREIVTDVVRTDDVGDDWQYDVCPLNTADDRMSTMIARYEQDTGKDITLSATAWRDSDDSNTDAITIATLNDRVRELEAANLTLTNTVATQQRELDRQSADLLAIHQRLSSIESRPEPQQRQIHQPWLPSTTAQPIIQTPPPPPTATPSRPSVHPPRRLNSEDDLPRNLILKLLRDHEDTKKVSKHLLGFYFTEEERLRCNVSGTRDAEQLDVERMDIVRQQTFKYSPVAKGLEHKVWRSCEISFDAARRNRKRDLKRLSSLDNVIRD
ncbi:uncharacterized protein [Antedon mediterranea]|uniref:uncharacterized protein n=1 Tax=Antedon mediterranea TaxID=105859 RepID=UPI003AF65410